MPEAEKFCLVTEILTVEFQNPGDKHFLLELLIVLLLGFGQTCDREEEPGTTRIDLRHIRMGVTPDPILKLIHAFA